MNFLPESVTKYLAKYSLPQWKLEAFFDSKIDNAIVIPVISEYENLRKLLASLLKNDNKYFTRTAIIVVVNNLPDSAEEVKTDNHKSLDFFRSIIHKNNVEDSLTQKTIGSNLNICLVDASSSGLEMPKKIGGVGLARKIGMDEALKLFDYSTASKKILICLDADCTVDFNYLTVVVDEFNKRNLSAAVVKYEHAIEEDIPTTHAIICYEFFLHYYVLGLKYANSPFAFHTIGSTMICTHESYIKIEGMNKQKAAEDFYFLEKLAKNYKIEKIDSTKVYPAARNSWRVPFGTGQRVGRFLSKKQNEYLLYDPVCFDILKAWLEVFNAEGIKISEEYLNTAKKIHPELSNFLMEQNFSEDWDRILKNSTRTEQLAKQKQLWFDGFRTIKLIHYLRDKAYPQIDMFEALNGLFKRLDMKKDFFWNNESVPSLNIQKMYLQLLREIQ